MQLAQELTPVSEEYLPSAQAMHASDTAAPVPELYAPAEQLTHTAAPRPTW